MNLFKKTVTAQKVHNELFDTTNNILIKIKQEMEEFNSMEETYSRQALAKLGFTNISKVKKFKIVQDQNTRNKKLEKLIRHYHHYYPQNKFVVESEIKTICNKYKIVYGRAEDFIGIIPLENEKEILNFKIRDEDVKIVKSFYEMNNREFEANDSIYEDYLKDNITRNYFNHIHTHHYIDSKIRVLATPDLFDMKNKQLNGHIIVEKQNSIILYPVRGGYLVITSWGPESGSVKNENRN